MPQAVFVIFLIGGQRSRPSQFSNEGVSRYSYVSQWHIQDFVKGQSLYPPFPPYPLPFLPYFPSLFSFLSLPPFSPFLPGGLGQSLHLKRVEGNARGIFFFNLLYD